MNKLLPFLFVLVFGTAFSQNERTYLKSTAYPLYGQTVDLKDKTGEDNVLYTLEIDLKENLSAAKIQAMQTFMQKDVSTAFIVRDANSNKLTFFTTKLALRHIEMFDYCKRMLLLAECSTDHTSYSQLILEIDRN